MLLLIELIVSTRFRRGVLYHEACKVFLTLSRILASLMHIEPHIAATPDKTDTMKR